MKTIIYSFFAILVFLACSERKNSPLITKTVITGQITNLENGAGRDNINITIKDLLSGSRDLTEYIDEEGRFRFEFDLRKPSDFYLKYSGLLTYYISPGDSLHFIIDNNCITTPVETYAQESAFYKVSGESEKMNNEIENFMILFQDSLVDNQKEREAVMSMEPMAFLKYKNEQLKHHQSAMATFNSSQNTSEEFRNWTNSFIKYYNWSTMMMYRYSHAFAIKEDPMRYVNQMPIEYFDFLHEMDDRKTEDLSVSSYLTFMEEYSVYIDQIIPIDSQEIYLSNPENELEKAVSYLSRYYTEIQKGFIKDVLISKLYYRVLEGGEYPRLKNVFDAELIEDQLLRVLVQKKFDEEKNLYENPPIYAEGIVFGQLDSKKDYVQELINKHPDQVIYIDFWAPWCAPCIDQFSHAAKLKKQFESKDIAFVYLANRCEEKAWKTRIASNQIEGQHYLLTKRQFEEFSKTFEIQGIPHYAIIDKKGDIVRKKAPQPSSGKLIELLSTHLE